MRGFLSALVVLGAAPLGAQTSGILSGDYIEGRSNHVYGCYCEWSGESQTGGTEAIVAWNIRSGAYRGASLAGVRLAAVIVGESTLSQGSPPRKSVVVVDSAASEIQRKAVEELVGGEYSRLIGRVIEVRKVPIQFEVAPEKATLKVGDLLGLALRKAILPEDALQGARLWYDPFIPLTESTLAVTVNNRYRGREFDTVWSRSEPGVTGYYGRFELKLE
jgi:hypothetical protein